MEEEEMRKDRAERRTRMTTNRMVGGRRKRRERSVSRRRGIRTML